MKVLRKIGAGLCWFILLAVVLAAAGAVIFYARLNDKVQQHILAELEKRYPNLHIRIGSTQIAENRGVSVKDIEFAVPNLSGKTRKLLHIGELFVEAPVNLQTLYQKKFPISRITVKNPILRATRYHDGTFRELQFLAEGFANTNGGLMPSAPAPIEVENGVLLYDDAGKSAAPLRLTGINLNITPEKQGKNLQIKGAADGDLFRRLTFEGAVQPETKQWHLTAQCRQFDWSDDLWQYLREQTADGRQPVKNGTEKNGKTNLLIAVPGNHSRSSAPFTPLCQGQFDLNITAVSDNEADFGCRFAVTGTLSHGRIDIPQINRTLTEIQTRFEITNEKIVIDKLTGSGDSCRFAVSYIQEGLLRKTKAELAANLRDFPIDENIAEILSPVLPATFKQLLARFDYNAAADIHGNIVFDGQRWIPKTISMLVSEGGFAYKPLPYRLDRLTGNLYIDESASLHFHFVTKNDEQVRADVEGHYHNIFADPAGSVTVIGDHVPIDQKLFRSLPAAVQRTAESLKPEGRIDARLVFTLPPGDAPLIKQISIIPDHISLCYEKFPYPLRDVAGLLKSDGDAWQFENFTGRNGSAVIKGSGYLHPVPVQNGITPSPNAPLNAAAPDDSAPQELTLIFSAEELPIDEQIEKALLNPEQRQLLQGLNVSGKVNLSANVKYRTDDKHLHLAFQATPLPGLSIMPDRFPYKIENVGGTLFYENGHVFAETLTGTHRDTKLRSGFDCRFEPNGPAVLRLVPLAVDQVVSNRELWDAMPKNLQEFMESLQISKPYNVSGGIEIRHFPNGEQTAGWDLNCVLHRNSTKIGLPVPIENIFGTVRLTGQSSPKQFLLNGELNLDSLTVNHFQVTQVRGPFRFDGRQVQLGIPANRLTPQIAARPISAKFCGGSLISEGLVYVGGGISYSINTALHGADLAAVAQEIEPSAKRMSGTLNCVNVNLQGSGTKWEALGGTGQIQLRDANMVEAPVMMRLFRELRIKETDPNAGMFTSADINFRLSGLQMFFDPIIFEGSAVSLYGNGVVRLDNRQMDLTMKTRLGNRRTHIPIVSDIIGGVGDQIIQLQITGLVSDPQVRRVVLPEIQKGLQPAEETSAELPLSRSRPEPSYPLKRNPF
ncbi:MAG: AsmA-like C-terminal region-containing protein [Planctomycetaceae bacterium]|nr:AsmA-like C-terminal region-containing protein [Planctomycetaceae bacterium]